MRKKAAKKLHNPAGFSLAETLLAVLILLLVSGIVAAGIPSARSAYEKTVLASNADVLLSTTISALRNELCTAQDVKVVGTTVSYFNSSAGTRSEISVNETASPSEIMYKRFASEYANSTPVPLISRETATGDLYVTYDSVDYKQGVVTFTNLSVNRTSGTEGLAKRGTLSIRVIAH